MKKICLIIAVIFITGCAGLSPTPIVRSNCIDNTRHCLNVLKRQNPDAEIYVRIGPVNCPWSKKGHVQGLVKVDGELVPLVYNPKFGSVGPGVDEFFGASREVLPGEAFLRACDTSLPVTLPLVREFANGFVSQSCGPVTAHYDPDVWTVKFKKEPLWKSYLF